VIDLIRSSWDLLVHMATTSPAGLWPMLLALAGSITFTQIVKKLVVPPTCSDLATKRWCQIVAILSGFTITALTMPTAAALVAGTIVGAASPFIYYIGVRVIGLKWPATREWLSQ
jgi:hypothetical protein